MFQTNESRSVLIYQHYQKYCTSGHMIEEPFFEPVMAAVGWSSWGDLNIITPARYNYVCRRLMLNLTRALLCSGTCSITTSDNDRARSVAIERSLIKIRPVSFCRWKANQIAAILRKRKLSHGSYWCLLIFMAVIVSRNSLFAAFSCRTWESQQNNIL